MPCHNDKEALNTITPNYIKSEQTMKKLRKGGKGKKQVRIIGGRLVG